MKSHSSSDLTGVYARTFCIFVFTKFWVLIQPASLVLQVPMEF